MTKEDTIKLAREAGFADGVAEIVGLQGFERFAALVAAAEREACAKLADAQRHCTEMLTSYPPQSAAARNIANAIRARGNI